ncbi:MAG TPA: NADH-quinone oxidoreductase subunit J [Pirellulales bacterium]|nr:NADH-quinone oxidoreductase subunit J [Pirellulales bacterium]
MDAINWHTFFFLLFSLFACGFAVATVVAANIVRMAMCLIISLGATAGLFFLAGADFVGSMQLLIYVGGTLVLLIFGVMLTAQGPFVSMKTAGGDWIVAVMLSGCLAALLVPAAFAIPDWRNRPATAEAHEDHHAAQSTGAKVRLTSAVEEEIDEKTTIEFTPLTTGGGVPDAPPKTSTPIGLGLLGARVDRLQPGSESLKPGMSGYLLPFELVSVHLLVVLVGAAYLARTKRRARPRS